MIDMIRIKFPDGTVKEHDRGITGLEIARNISPRLADEALAVSVNGKVCDLSRPINEDAEIKLFKWDDEEGKRTFWHSSSHLMAEALEALFPGIRFGIGPSIDNGFYYDVDAGDKVITDADLKKSKTKCCSLPAKNNSLYAATSARTRR